MSTFWRGPARNSTAYKAARLAVLQRDGWKCQINTPDVCLRRASQAHHLDGVTQANLCDTSRMVAACKPCNQAEGRPAGDPAPGKHTAW